MTPLTLAHRAFFLVVSGFTAWVGFIGMLTPADILRALPWPLPPLHARFVAALYLSATLFLLLSLCSRTRAQVRAILVIAFVWTGWLLGVTLVHWSSFDLGHRPVWFWLFAYLTFPVAAAWLGQRDGWLRTPAPAPRSRWAFAALGLIGGIFAVLGIACFVVPGTVAAGWPWTITPFIAQVYSGPLLGYAAGCLLLARDRDAAASVIPLIGLAVFAVLALVASGLHGALFTPGAPSTIAWFATLGGIAVAAPAILAATARQRVAR